MARVLIVHVDRKMKNYMESYGELLKSHDHEVVEISLDTTSRIEWVPSVFDIGVLTQSITRVPDNANRFDMVVIFDEYEHILKIIRNLLPAKVPVLYMDIYGEIDRVPGLIWFGYGECVPHNVLEEVNKIKVK